DVFLDCSIHSPSTPLAYPWRSKICAAGAQTYAEISRFDPLSTSIQALHILNKYQDASHLFSAGLNRSVTPEQTAADLERRFDELAFGIPKCMPDATLVLRVAFVRSSSAHSRHGLDTSTVARPVASEPMRSHVLPSSPRSVTTTLLAPPPEITTDRSNAVDFMCLGARGI